MVHWSLTIPTKGILFSFFSITKGLKDIHCAPVETRLIYVMAAIYVVSLGQT